MLVTFAFVLIIAGVSARSGALPTRQVTAPPFVHGGVDILDGAIPKYNFFFMAVAVAVGVALWAMLYRTGLGRMIRAAVSDPTLLGLSGVNVRRLFTTVFVIAAFLAGFAGALTHLRARRAPTSPSTSSFAPSSWSS